MNRLVLVLNVPAHYQVSLGKAFYSLLKSDFSMVCWEGLPAEQVMLGWHETECDDWLLRAWTSRENRDKAIEMIRTADVVIWGHAPESEVGHLTSRDKLTFRYSERPFKSGTWRVFDPRVLRHTIALRSWSRGENFHLLSVGPYCERDFRLIGAFPGRMWRWGYFVEHPTAIPPRENRDEALVLWAGRMIPWKRVDLLLRAAEWVRRHDTAKFRIRLVGRGPEEAHLRALAANLGLSDVCEFHPPVSPELVGEEMEKADIYVFPSDRHEGWGCVVNEAMSRGCCVIGSNAAGSVPWLIRHGVNGLAFDGANPRSLGELLRQSVSDPKERSRIGAAARATIGEYWAPHVATARFVALMEALESGRPSPFTDGGPCSPL